MRQALDDAIYRQKHYLLTHPDHQEEIDYVLKPLAKVRQQLAFDRFEHMVACKILCECQLLYGSPFLFDEIMKLVERLRRPQQNWMPWKLPPKPNAKRPNRPCWTPPPPPSATRTPSTSS